MVQCSIREVRGPLALLMRIDAFLRLLSTKLHYETRDRHNC
jgi:hypothetical protein